MPRALPRPPRTATVAADATVREEPFQDLTPGWLLTLAGVLAAGVLAASCWTAGHVHADAALQTVARFLHVVSMVAGLGSVLAVDWLALLWLTGRRPLAGVLDTAAALQTPIWAGMGGLTVSGLLLHPELGSPLTLVKLGLVLAVTLNGLYAHRLGQLLERFREHGDVPRRLLVRSGAAAGVSQVGWWGATFIGFLNSQS
ncbi:hypothetical protein [Streptomyces sp. NPDC051921]|uniref:hypothetical protein n=1 Tax=Streptomyces sp. NPDC051921 TaxID=3155806 RepID=UPI003440C1F3